MVGFWRALYATFGYEYPDHGNLYRPTEKTLHQRHLVMEQLKNSKIKLKPIYPSKKKEIFIIIDDDE